MPALRPVPDTPPRALGMIRVSKERDGMMSPDVQRAAITDYCRTRGYEVAGWLEGIDESGSRAKSAWWPRLDAAAAQVEAGTYDVIVVWKFSRTARSRLRWAIALDRVEAAGGRIESATEQVDATTSTGRFTRGMLAELNAFEAERIGEVWKSVHDARLAQGLAPQGTPKYGYVWNRDRKVHEVDPVTAPVLAEVYERYIAGESFYMLTRWLNDNDHPTRDGNTWTDRSLRRVLDSGFAAGLIPWRGEKHPGVHEAVIDKVTWQAYQDARSRRQQAPRRVERSRYLLSGLVRCARCGGTMVANNPGDGKRKPAFRCKTSKERGPAACLGGYVAMDVVEAEVRSWLEEVRDDVDAAAALASSAVAAKTSSEGEVRRLGREVAKIDDALHELTMQLAEKLVPQATYVAVRDDYLARRGVLADKLEMAARTARATDTDPAAAAGSLLEDWRELSVEVRRAALGSLIQVVRVTTGDRRGVAGVQGGRSNAVVEVVPAWS